MGVLMHLLLLLNTRKDSSVDYHIAALLLAHFSEIQSMRLGEMAALCFVSKSTMSKFIRHLGYADFSEFKLSVAYRSDRFTNLLNYNDNILGYLMEHSPAEYIDLMIQDLQHVKQTLDQAAIDVVVQDLFQYDTVAAFGLMYSESAALDFQMKLAYNQKYIISYMDEERQYAFIRQADRHTLLIIFSNSGDYIKKYQFIKPYIEKNIFQQTKAKVVLITCNPSMRENPAVDTCVCLEHSSGVQTHQVLFQFVTDLIASGYRRKLQKLRQAKL